MTNHDERGERQKQRLLQKNLEIFFSSLIFSRTHDMINCRLRSFLLLLSAMYFSFPCFSLSVPPRLANAHRNLPFVDILSSYARVCILFADEVLHSTHAHVVAYVHRRLTMTLFPPRLCLFSFGSSPSLSPRLSIR